MTGKVKNRERWQRRDEIDRRKRRFATILRSLLAHGFASSTRDTVFVFPVDDRVLLMDFFPGSSFAKMACSATLLEVTEISSFPSPLELYSRFCTILLYYSLVVYYCYLYLITRKCCLLQSFSDLAHLSSLSVTKVDLSTLL